MRLRARVVFDVDKRKSPVQPRARSYRPHFVPEGSTTMLGVQFEDGPETIAPGGSGEVEFECLYRDVSYDELRPGVRFTIVEGPTAVGSGIVL